MENKGCDLNAMHVSGQNRKEGSELEKGGVIGEREEVERSGRVAGMQHRLAWSGFKSMETITELQPELVTSSPPLYILTLFIPLWASNREQRERGRCGQKCKRSSCGNPTFTSVIFWTVSL